MNENLTAKAAALINADKRKVWDALVTPEAIKQYMFGAQVESDWKAGGKITWKGEFKGTKYEDKGEILRFDPEETLQYSHFSPLSGKPDEPANYHTVTIDLSGEGDGTRVSLSQDNNEDQKAREESEKNWDTMLKGLKEYVENTSARAA